MLKPEKLVPYFACVNLTATCMLTKNMFKQNSVRFHFGSIYYVLYLIKQMDVFLKKCRSCMRLNKISI